MSGLPRRLTYESDEDSDYYPAPGSPVYQDDDQWSDLHWPEGFAQDSLAGQPFYDHHLSSETYLASEDSQDFLFD